MGNCSRLKWNRTKVLGLSQKEFADRYGLCAATISKLETDETAWTSIQTSTFDKLAKAFEGENFWPIKNLAEGEAKSVNEIIEEKKQETDTDKTWAEKVVIMLNNSLTEQDKETMKLVEFAVEGLKEAETHEKFEANIDLLKRILKKY